MRELSFSASFWREGIDILAAFGVCVCVYVGARVCREGERAYILACSSLYRWSSSCWINHRKFLSLSKLALHRKRAAYPPLCPPLQPSIPSLSSLPLPLVHPSSASPPFPCATLPHCQSHKESEAGPANRAWIGPLFFVAIPDDFSSQH